MRPVKKFFLAALLCVTAAWLSGCALRVTDEMYCLPKHSEEYNNLQTAIDKVMTGLEYCAPTYGENQQTVQMADLDGDGEEEALLFAKSTGENPLKIFIFDKVDGAYVNTAQIESAGAAHKQAEYVQMDDADGVELIVGRQVGEEVPYSLAVYTFRDGQPKLLLTTNYAWFRTTDLNGDQRKDLFVLSQDIETGKGVAELYYCGEKGVERSTEATMSVPADQVRRITMGNMCEDTPAVFVASVYGESTIITDVYAMLDGKLTNVSLSNESGTSVGTIRNYYVYADDLDGDGLIELPALVPMAGAGGQEAGENQNLIQWYNLDREGGEHRKLTTYHNYTDGWYVILPEEWVETIYVLPSEDGVNGKSYVFGVWNEDGTVEKLFTISAFTGDDREKKAADSGYFEVGRKAEVIYCASLGTGSLARTLRQEDVVGYFNFIQIAWKTGET